MDFLLPWAARVASLGGKMSEFQPLIDELYREEIREARALGTEGRLRLAFQMMEENFAWARTLGEAEMNRRFAIGKKLKEQGCYGPAVPRQ